MQEVQSLPWREVIGGSRDLSVPPEVLDACRSVSLRIGGPRVKCIGVTSTIRDEGRSLVAQALALIQAYDYRRQVILVELDFESASMAERLRLPARPGVADLVQGDVPLSDVLAPAGSRVSVITAGVTLPDSAGAILERLSGGVLTSIQNEAEVLVLDLPPLLASSYGRPAAELCEQLVMVIRAGITPLPRIRQAMDSLSIQPALLLNGVDSSLPRWMKQLLSV